MIQSIRQRTGVTVIQQHCILWFDRRMYFNIIQYMTAGQLSFRIEASAVVNKLLKCTSECSPWHPPLQHRHPNAALPTPPLPAAKCLICKPYILAADHLTKPVLSAWIFPVWPSCTDLCLTDRLGVVREYTVLCLYLLYSINRPFSRHPSPETRDPGGRNIGRL